MIVIIKPTIKPFGYNDKCLKTTVRNILENHLVPFIGYLAAFLAPVGGMIIAIQVVVFSDYLICKLLVKKRNIPSEYRWEKILVIAAVYIWVLLMLRVLEDFIIKDTHAVSNIFAGYVLWNHLKKLIKNIDAYANIKLWDQVEELIKKIKV